MLRQKAAVVGQIGGLCRDGGDRVVYALGGRILRVGGLCGQGRHLVRGILLAADILMLRQKAAVVGQIGGLCRDGGDRVVYALGGRILRVGRLRGQRRHLVRGVLLAADILMLRQKARVVIQLRSIRRLDADIVIGGGFQVGESAALNEAVEQLTDRQRRECRGSIIGIGIRPVRGHLSQQIHLPADILMMRADIRSDIR